MYFLAGTLHIIFAYLLSIYYKRKANEDDYNRPSFFNSKFRKYLFLVIIAYLFLAGAYLLFLSGLYWAIFIILLLCYFGYSHYKMEILKSTIVKHSLTYYKVLRNPEISFETKEQLIGPIGLMLVMIKKDDQYRKKVDEYLNKRIEEGKFTEAKQIPLEAWSVIACLSKKEITPQTAYPLEQKRIDYFYEEIIKGKEHHNLSKRILNSLYDLQVRIEHMFGGFSFISLPRPDFTQEEIQLVRKSEYCDNPKKGEENDEIAIFSNNSEQLAIKLGWVANSEEYFFLSGLEYSRRFPDHKFSKLIKKKYKYTKQKIFDYAQNWEKLDS